MPPNLKQRFSSEYLTSPWQRFRFWLILRKIRRIKLAGLWEANVDKLFLESQYGDHLSYDDSEDRKALAEEQRKPLDKQDIQKIGTLEDKISLAKTIKSNWRKNETFRGEVRSYVTMIDQWKSQR